MPLAHFVFEAKKHTPVAKAVVSTEQESRIIDASSFQRQDLKRTMATISEGDKAAAECESAPSWTKCQYLKSVGETVYCKQYLALCAKEKCQKKFMDADFFDFKKYLKQGKRIK